MNTRRVIVGIAIFAAISWAITTHQETEKQRAIVNDVRHLVEACKSMGNSEPITIRGKALVWNMNSNSRSSVHDILPTELKASSHDNTITVFMVLGKRDVKVGTYSISGQPGYQQFIDVCVAYWPEKKAIGMGSVVSKQPRLSRPVQGSPEYGDPNEPVKNWITSLWDKALTVYNEAINSNPESDRAYNNRGAVYMDKGEFDKAIADFNKAIEINPRLDHAYDNLGFIYMVKLGNKEKACLNWKRACELGRCYNYERAKKDGDCK